MVHLPPKWDTIGFNPQPHEAEPKQFIPNLPLAPSPGRTALRHLQGQRVPGARICQVVALRCRCRKICLCLRHGFKLLAVSFLLHLVLCWLERRKNIEGRLFWGSGRPFGPPINTDPYGSVFFDATLFGVGLKETKGQPLAFASTHIVFARHASKRRVSADCADTTQSRTFRRETNRQTDTAFGAKQLAASLAAVYPLEFRPGRWLRKRHGHPTATTTHATRGGRSSRKEVTDN